MPTPRVQNTMQTPKVQITMPTPWVQIAMPTPKMQSKTQTIPKATIVKPMQLNTTNSETNVSTDEIAQQDQQCECGIDPEPKRSISRRE